MNELEKKIKYHLDLILGIKKDWSKLAEGLSEIAEKYYKKKADHIFKIYKSTIRKKIVGVLDNYIITRRNQNGLPRGLIRDIIADKILGDNNNEQ